MNNTHLMDTVEDLIASVRRISDLLSGASADMRRLRRSMSLGARVVLQKISETQLVLADMIEDECDCDPCRDARDGLVYLERIRTKFQPLADRSVEVN